jgi:putative tryptophan/tyrosine transport system substrate-binding protein
MAARKATDVIPIVFATAANPVEQGLIKSLQRPGGNITGGFWPGTGRQLVEIARETFPTVVRLGVLAHSADPAHRLTMARFEPAAKRFGFEPIVARFADDNELAAAVAKLAERNVHVTIPPEQAFFISHRKLVVELATKSRNRASEPF